MTKKNYLQDIHHIKDMMNKSSQFLSLSGLSGVLAGCYALLGAAYAKYLSDQNTYQYITLESVIFKKILITAAIVLVLSVFTGWLLSSRKAKKAGEVLWNSASRRLMVNFLIPLVTGGLLIMLMLKNGSYGLVVPMALIFYGLACVNSSKFTFRQVRYLGITEIILGLFAVEYSGYGLYFWVMGFGICNILYGAIMYFKYDRK
ncbi:hypothetical protein [Flavobacterium sp. '19STA2R22 D10 B1']|uniref:hypothetical protein n=1 Tax=Flavobacterium aerium TaxID=3037261 RepID=UPI00278BC868|nr:hypothetical protein [Flavobacterium sp. '19STA2R22 D10 B1']